MHDSTPTKRHNEYDWIRAVATVSVVLQHVFTALVNKYTVSELGVRQFLAWGTLRMVIGCWAVPCFLMVTGALLLDPNKQLGWEKLWRYVRKVLLALITFGFAFCLVEVAYAAHAVTPRILGKALLRLLAGNSWDHMWYCYALLGVYAWTPVLRSYVAQASKRDLQIVLALLLVLTLMRETAKSALRLTLFDVMWVSNVVFYYLLGWYARRYLKMAKRTLVTGACVMLVLVAAIAMRILGGKSGRWIANMANPLVACFSLALFLALSDRFASVPISRAPAAAYLSRHSFGIYLVHPIFMNILYKLLHWWPYVQLPPVLFEVAVFSIALCGSVLLVEVLSRLPIMRDVV